jgi:hypothetical protein
VSFVVELAAQNVAAEQGQAIEAATREREAWPVRYVPAHMERRWLFKRRAIEPSLVMPESVDGRSLLSDQAIWDQPFWDLEREFRPRLATSFRILGERLPQGFRFRATWGGDEVRDTVSLSADELAERAAASAINEYTVYFVPPCVPSSSRRSQAEVRFGSPASANRP